MTVPADAPPPALGELARRATAVIEAEAELARYPYGSLERAWAARATGIARNDFRAAATASAVLQLVALATGGATDTARLDALDALEDASLEQRDEDGVDHQLWWRMPTRLRDRGCTNPLDRPIRDAIDALTPERPADAK